MWTWIPITKLPASAKAWRSMLLTAWRVVVARIKSKVILPSDCFSPMKTIKLSLHRWMADSVKHYQPSGLLRIPFGFTTLCKCPPGSMHTQSYPYQSVTHHVWQDSVERTDVRRLTQKRKRIYQRRKKTRDAIFGRKTITRSLLHTLLWATFWVANVCWRRPYQDMKKIARCYRCVLTFIST